VTESRSEETNTEYQDVTEQIEADGEPLLNGNGHVIRAIFQVEASFGIFNRAFLNSKTAVSELKSMASAASLLVHDMLE
jgi:hypothetical protein